MNKVIVIAGPTSSGKTQLGKKISQTFNGVVISVDSRQIYKELDLGTGKDKTFHQEMIDIVNPETNYSVAMYSKSALQKINQILDNKQLPVLVGGAGYYLESLLFDIHYPDISNEKIVQSLEKFTTEELYQQLSEIDQESALRSQKNRRKLIRYLEIVKTTGEIVPKIKKDKRFNYLMLILDPGKENVSRYIEERLNGRLKQGLVEEVQKLRQKYDHNWLAKLGLEYEVISEYLDGKMNEYEMKESLLNVNKKYAKRQRTWLRRYQDAMWISNPFNVENIIRDFLNK